MRRRARAGITCTTIRAPSSPRIWATTALSSPPSRSQGCTATSPSLTSRPGGTGGAALAASLYLPEGVAVDGVGRLYISDTENCQVRRMEAGGIVSVLGHETCGYSMGGDADLGPWLHTNHPRGAAAGPGGVVSVADIGN